MQIRSNNGMLFSVSKAEKNDLKEILDLQLLAYKSEAQLFGTTDIPPLKQTIDDIQSEFAELLFLKVTDENGKIVASVRGRETDGTMHIGKLIVLPSQQGQGIGSKLLQEVEEICRCTRSELFTSTRSSKNILFYTKLGYLPFREEKISEDLTFVYMQKDITNKQA